MKNRSLSTAKTLLVASMATLSMGGAYAAENLAPVPVAANDETQGTLDKLAGQNIPGSDPAAQYPTAGSAYTLTKVQEGGVKPTGDNIVTKFTYNSETKTMTPVYYKLDLKQTTYGEGDSTNYYNWEKDENGNIALVKSEQSNGDISVTYNKATDSRYTNSVDKTSETVNLNFVGQKISGGNNQVAGALYNTGKDAKIGVIKGDFIENGIIADAVEGGAIANYSGASINEIDGNFVGNYVYSTDVNRAYGGAIENDDSSTIGTINGNFIGNYALKEKYKSGMIDTLGGAIANFGTINNLNGDFIGNYTKTNTLNDGSNTGGAIGNLGNIGSINGNFINNYALNGNLSKAGAIYNSGSIGNITGDFIGNYVKSSSSYGGAIYNLSTINNITGDFIGNYVQGTGAAYGGAIFNSSSIANLTGDFIGNSITSNGYSYGGAIFSSGSISGIVGDFIGNSSVSTNSAYGAAVLNNKGTIGSITGDFIANYNTGKGSGSSYGAAIFNSQGTIGDINGDFIGNYSLSETGSARGGAIYNNSGSLGNITGDFINNYSSTTSSAVGGGAIYNWSSVGDINGNFIGNYSAATENEAKGGAIYNNYSGNIASLKGDFIENYASGYNLAMGGAIYNNYESYYSSGGVFNTITGNFVDNYATATGPSYGGAIATVSNINGQYDDIDPANVVVVSKLVVLNVDTGERKCVYSARLTNSNDPINFDNLSATVKENGYKIRVENIGSQYANSETWSEIDKLLSSGLYFDTDPESIFTKDDLVQITGGIVNSSFVGNYAKSEIADAKGGAIYAAKNVRLTAKDGYTSVISGNYVEDKNGKRPEAIYMDNSATLTINAQNKGSFVIDDQINGNDGYIVNIEGDDTGVVYLNNNIKAEAAPVPNSSDETQESASVNNPSVYVSLSNITLNLGRDNVLDNNNLTLNSGTINMLNNKAGVSALNTFTLVGNTNMVADVDLANKTMDRFTANNYGQHFGKLNVVGMNMLSDAPEGRDVTDIYFAQIGLKDNVVNGVNETPTGYQTTAYTPIYKYHVMYDNRDDGGHFLFTKGDNLFNVGGGITNTGNPSDAFNPSVLASPVASQAGAYSTQLQTFNYAFNHSDSFMNIPYLERISMKYENQYALASTGNATDVGVYSPIYTKHNNAGIWVKPYASFESIPLKNGPKVSNITYGTLIGFDGELKRVKRGYERVLSGYVGYNGASQRYSGVDSTQNGGLIGGTMTFYKGNFFNATTLSVGASVANNTNMYGKEDMTMLIAGIGNKTGYNLEFKEGRFIIQPSLLLSYTFVNTFDYTNSAGVRIDSDPLNAIQISPGVKFIGNLPHGWQPYIGVNMVWNILGESKVRANNVMLPEMSIKPYVQYGVGVQKVCKDRFTAYGQAMITNGGRNGISLTGGFRWALGKEGKPIQKVSNPQNKTAHR